MFKINERIPERSKSIGRKYCEPLRQADISTYYISLNKVVVVVVVVVISEISTEEQKLVEFNRSTERVNSKHWTPGIGPIVLSSNVTVSKDKWKSLT